MNKSHSRFISILDKILIIYIIVNPLIDFFTGLYIKEFLGITELDISSAVFVSTPSLIIRLAMLAVFGIYMLVHREKVGIMTLIIMGAAFCLSIAMLMLGGVKLQISVDIKYFVKYCYNIAMLFAYLALMRNMCRDKNEFIEKVFFVVKFTCIVCALGIIVPYIFSIGYYTYADRLGLRGCRGYFYSGNDITAIFTILLPLTIAYFLKSSEPVFSKKSLIPILSASLSIIALLLIGTKTAFIAVIGSSALMFLFTLFAIPKKGTKMLTRALALILVTLVLFALLGCIVGFDRLLFELHSSAEAPSQLAQSEGSEIALLSGRSYKLHYHVEKFLNGGVLAWLFGIGRSTVTSIIEMELFEVFIYYGLVGALAMLWLYVWLAVEFIKAFFKNFDIISFALLIGIGMTFGYLTLAGHVLFTVTSGQYFVLAIAFSRLYFAKSAEEAAIRPKLLCKLVKA